MTAGGDCDPNRMFHSDLDGITVQRDSGIATSNSGPDIDNRSEVDLAPTRTGFALFSRVNS